MLPLAEILLEYYDQLKSVSRGYASLDYAPVGYRPGDLVKLDVLVAHQPVGGQDHQARVIHAHQRHQSIFEGGVRGRTGKLSPHLFLIL